LIVSIFSRSSAQGRKTLAARRYSVGAIPTLAAKKRVKPLWEEKPRSKPISAIGTSVATSASERLFHDQCIEIEVRGDAGLGAEQPVEVRTRQPGGPRDRIQFDLGARAFGHQLDGFADAKSVTAAVVRVSCTGSDICQLSS
jgi:hypothetical protein